ncbi:MAG: hypothetical protein HY843_04260 [Bdellovibrio sp.]|nr:hypothetical protein [Bdellovibrio sp.]
MTETTQDMQDIKMVQKWLRFDPLRWLAGAMGGLLSGAVGIIIGSLYCYYSGHEIWFFLKLGALPALGANATEIGLYSNAIFTGFLFYEGMALILGVVFSHFTWTNSFFPLLVMGLVWGIFTWIFIFNLFIQSIPQVLAAEIRPGATLPLCLVFGFALISVAFFDRVLRGGST